MKHIFNSSDNDDKRLINEALGGSKTALEHLLKRKRSGMSILQD